MNKDLKNVYREQLQELVLGYDQKGFLADYIFTFIHSKHANSIMDISTLPQDFRRRLMDDGYYISSLKKIEQFEDPDGTVKFVFELPDSLRIETVLMRDDDRKTVCISTQAGCRMACRFCATGKISFERNLTAAEIIDQVYQVDQWADGIQNVVYMGMGEPFDNYDNTLRSVYLLNHPKGLNIGQRHITVSTVGLPRGIRLFTEEKCSQVRLAVSLHASNDAVRKRLIPIANKYTFYDIFEALREYQIKNGRRVTIEYCMIDGINDQPKHARELADMLESLNVFVNLIEYNPHPGCTCNATPKDRIEFFQKILNENGIETAIRYKRGRSIRAACGQLGADWLRPK